MTDPPLGTANVTTVPAADVTAPMGIAGSVVHQAFPLRQPEEDANEILIQVRGSNLRRVRKRLNGLAGGKFFPWAEVLLGISTLAFGGTLGALASDIPWAVVNDGSANANWNAVFFFVLLPVIGFSAGVAYLMLRHFRAQDASGIAREVLDDLPDPDRAL